MGFLDRIASDEAFRREQFPVAAERIFLAHAGTCPLPRVAAEAMREYIRRSEVAGQESSWALGIVRSARENAARLIGAEADEIALLGPTSLGLSLVAHGLDWQPGDEVVAYFEDYPANVYPWTQLGAKGVKYVGLQPESPGVITWELVEAALRERTKLVALASCHFLSGYRIDLEAIGRNLRERGVLFCIDGIQTLGAFPTPVEHVDFLSADSHKWMLGPAAAGIFYVKKSQQPLLRPTLVGAVNICSPDFIAQEGVRFVAGAERFESGILNLAGIAGMDASMRLILEIGQENISARLLELRAALLERVRPLGYRLYLEEHDLDPGTPDATRSAIVSLGHPEKDLREVYARLKENGVVTSYRKNRGGEEFVRLSPHFYHTVEEMDRVVEVMR